jgi:serine/threonine protein kinase
VIPDFLWRREVATCEALARRRPDLAATIGAALEDARARGYAPLDALLERGTVPEREHREALAAQSAAGAPPLGWGPFDVGLEVGRGRHGVVLWARHRPTDAACALKVLRAPPDGLAPRRLERFLREARLLGRLEHPGIARLVDAGDVDGTAYLATEALRGGALDALGAAPPRRALALAEAVARALAHAHAAGVVHRDLRPANVLLDLAGAPRVVDFGLARDLLDPGGLTRSNALLGTPHFAAPEQLVMAGRVEPAADVYAAGALTWFLLTGVPPFAEARTVGALFEAQRRGLAGLGPCPGLAGDARATVEAVLGRALAASPRARPSMLALAEGLACARQAAGL